MFHIIILTVLQCFIISIENAEGLSYSRGCVQSLDKIPFYCNTKHHMKKMNRSSSYSQHSYMQYSTSCCSGNLCNHYAMPTLAPRYNDGNYLEIVMNFIRVNILFKLHLYL